MTRDPRSMPWAYRCFCGSVHSGIPYPHDPRSEFIAHVKTTHASRHWQLWLQGVEGTEPLQRIERQMAAVS